MHHLFVTPILAGAVTAAIIVLSPSFSDPYEAAYASEEPVVERLNLEFSSSISAPAELLVPEISSNYDNAVVFAAPRRVALLKTSMPDVLTDVAFTLGDTVISTAPIIESETVPLRAEMPLLEVVASRMNLRAGPGTTFKKVGNLPGGTLLEQTGNSKGPWLEIAVLETGKTGWLHSNYLKQID